MIKVAAFDVIRSSTVLHGLNDAELARLAELCEERQMAEGTTVFIENMPGESLFLIRKGTIRISKMFAEGDEKTLVVLGPEDVFGEMAVVDGLPRSATARVAEDAVQNSLKKKDFETLCKSDPGTALKLAMNVMRVFSMRIREVNDEYRDMLVWSIKGDKA
ncbi:MAG: cyclic nucleotide-binding domain-containing protein [Desulfuromonas sp.]|nr:cyclic nucleotide-binding domain-containing protein [Desulfuromonas sp.]